MELRDPPPVRTAEGKPTEPDPTSTHSRDITGMARAVLHAIAQSDPRPGVEELKILMGYCGGVGLKEPAMVEATAATAEGILPARESRRSATAEPVTGAPRSTAPPADLSAMPVDARLHLLRLMFRTAYANGPCNDLELSVLRRVADVMGLTGDHFAATKASTEDELRRGRRKRNLLGALAILAVFALAFLVVDKILDWIEPGEELRIEQALVERARRDARAVAATAAKVEQLEQRIARILDEREREQATTPAAPSSPAVPSSGDELREEIRALRFSLEKLQAQPDVFKRLESRYHGSVVLIMVAFDLVADGTRRTLTGYGSGFFVTPTGLILTNKHVVEPWKFEVEVAELLDAGHRLDESSIRMAAWPTGARVWKAPGKAIFGNAFNNLQGTLRLVAAPPDEVERVQVQRPDGRTYSGRLHLQSNSDLALLQAEVESPVVPLPLATDPAEIEKLDPVMVLGFPSGPAMLESDRAETSPSLGTVRKVEETVQVSAPIVQGNSGGPVIDLDGKVVGIATRSAFGEASLGVCIQSRHVLDLLPTAAELVGDAARLIDDGHGELALSLLDLATLRNPDHADTARIDHLRAGLR